MTTITLPGTKLATVPCASCGLVFAIPDEYDDRRREDHRTFYCPNGHHLNYNAESEAEKYKRLFHTAEKRAGRNYDEAEAAKRSLAATRGVVTKLRARAHAGTCPFGCRRHFANLERHVASKHPGEKLEAEA